MRKDLINEINNIASYFNVASKWQKSRTAFGHVESKTQTNYVYELYCLMQVVNELKKNPNITLKFNTFGAKGKEFPKKPADKVKGWAKFEIYDIKTKIKYDLCGGIKIYHTHFINYSVAPDISIQDSGNSNPLPSQIHMIMDSKYTSNPKSIISISTLREFKAIISDIFGKNRINLYRKPYSFRPYSCYNLNILFTNGDVNTFQSDYSNRNLFSQVGKFYPNSTSVNVI